MHAAPYVALSAAPRLSVRAPVAHRLSVEISDPEDLSDFAPHWRDLIQRADTCNVFMHPGLVGAAAQIYPGNLIRVLVAWKYADQTAELAGVWAFCIARARRAALPVTVLNTPAFPNAYVAAPVIDRRYLEEVWSAMLDRVADEPCMPKLATLDGMCMDEPTMAALRRVIAARRSRMWVTASATRPKLASGMDAKAYLERALSAATRKKLRQHRNRLGRRGALASTVARDPQCVREAVEQFLSLEAAGWKGQNGTALMCSPCDAAFARTAIPALAREGCAAVHMLCLDGKPLSMQIVLQCGRAAFTWKTAYDEEFRDFSPGMLLFEDYTSALLADPTVAYVDSCAYDDNGFMGSWMERQPLGDLWFDVRPGGSWRSDVYASSQMSYRALRDVAKERSAPMRRAWRG